MNLRLNKALRLDKKWAVLKKKPKKLNNHCNFRHVAVQERKGRYFYEEKTSIRKSEYSVPSGRRNIMYHFITNDFILDSAVLYLISLSNCSIQIKFNTSKQMYDCPVGCHVQQVMNRTDAAITTQRTRSFVCLDSLI